MPKRGKRIYKKKKIPKVKSMIKYLKKSLVPKLHRFSGILFPERLRASVKCTYSFNVSYGAAVFTNTYLTTNYPVNVFTTQVCSGLAWLIGTLKSDGSSPAPYSQGIVYRSDMKFWIQTATTGATTTQARICVYPLAGNQATDNVSITQAVENYQAKSGLSSDISTSYAPIKPVIYYTNYPYVQLGIGKEIYLNSPNQYSFLKSTAPAQVTNLCIKMATNSGAVDATLVTTTVANITYHCEFFNRNQPITSAPQ